MTLTFYLQILAAVAIGPVVGWLGRCLRIGALGSVIFLGAQLALIYRSGFASILGLTVVLALFVGYIMALRKSPTPGGRTRPIALMALLAYIGYWALEKYLLPLGLLPSWHFSFYGFTDALTVARTGTIVGISYIGFKFLHFAVDFQSGEIAEIMPFEFLNWLFFFPSIVAGPMQRYQDWLAQRMAAGHLSLAEAGEGGKRILIGLFLKIAIADTIHGASIVAMGDGTLSTATFPRLILSAAIYSLYLYSDFAGYSSIAIGVSRFWGIELPENFRAPFLARNLIEFWKRWHITFSELLRDYLFYPLSLFLKRTAFSKKIPVLTIAIPPLITFILAGVWHGAGVRFFLYGLIHGVGLSFLAIVKRFGPKTGFLPWWEASRLGYFVGCCLNFFYVTFSFLFFGLSSEKLMILWDRLSITAPPSF